MKAPNVRSLHVLVLALATLMAGCAPGPVDGDGPSTGTDSHVGSSLSIGDHEVFDLRAYQIYNPDVAAACDFDYDRHWSRSNICIRTQPGSEACKNWRRMECMEAHWTQWGRREGRRAAPWFDVKTYVALNPDLAAAFGTNWEAAINHYIEDGQYERRTASICAAPVYEDRVYRALNPDLAGDGTALCTHWERHGLAEGRRASTEFDVGFYKALYADIAPMSNTEAAFHFAKHGVKESRTASFCSSPLFDIGTYAQTYPDVDAYVRQSGQGSAGYCYHWERHGMQEGRRSSSRFWVSYYKAAHPDLAGLDNRTATFHFVKHGIHERRRGAP